MGKEFRDWWNAFRVVLAYMIIPHQYAVIEMRKPKAYQSTIIQAHRDDQGVYHV